MEAEEGEKKKPTKRKMKTAYQRELLEETYAVDRYPSESVRAELAVKLGLTDRQLQMWFCHRRLKDRKEPPAKRSRKDSATSVPVVEVAKREDMIVRPMVKRYYDQVPSQSMLELRVIEIVESQLGERLREDGPILGHEFDPLPPGAFGAPIVTPQTNQSIHPYDGKIYERHDTKTIKTSTQTPTMEHSFVPNSSSRKRKFPIGNVHASRSQIVSRAPPEHQFLPEQPSMRLDSYVYDSPADAPMPAAGAFIHENETVLPSYPFQSQASNASPGDSMEYRNLSHKNAFANIRADTQSGSHPLTGLEIVSLERQILSEEDASEMERKHKSEVVRTQKDVEAHEKRIKKELQRQGILRRKREEQMRREMRKEEDRILREKQREEERFQREQRRENERRERLLQKESLKAEKRRLKEEHRREKEVARVKAANERAAARRMAREYMELIEDDRLEFMELAASSKSLPSITALDCDSLQQLELFKDMLTAFPPKSVQMKKPFAIQPWSDSNENVGNLLMVWRFLITFTDVLELWPFTLDEFIQAFHDYDSRLLGEIHVALLKSIIKDIEVVARTPALALGANHNSATNPGGGHPQIVEGLALFSQAYAWGFDIRSWNHHLNPLTWPEVLRQFALSAGFGPQLGKRNIEPSYFRYNNEGNDCEDAISTLRDGSAAENAAALMQVKGFPHLRRSRHRLTPGTVKFAAFHVLSLEGSNGLTILEVAEKIQKSGLRDLTTSKTPEASISAALSRDTKLFERTAPSTYCVRSPYRKDPADAEAILTAARENLRIFENRLSESEEAEKDTEDADDVERDYDSESDGADDPEVDDVSTVSNSKLENVCVDELKVSDASACSHNGTLLQNIHRHGEKVFSSSLETHKNHTVSGDYRDHSHVPQNCEGSHDDLEDTEIDESGSGEPWVQGLMEGEYSDLNVEERLNALVALIGFCIEGNSIRVILEGRLDAANALKKQMWAEAQHDKRRMKEESVTMINYPSFAGGKPETNSLSTVAEGDPSPKEQFTDSQDPNDLNDMPTEKNLVSQELIPNQDMSLYEQYGYAAEKSRLQMKSLISHRAEEIYVYRSLPLGQDRRRNHYWQFVTSASKNDPGSGRIFFESQQHGYWRLIDSEEAFDNLVAALDTRGIRESHLHSMLQKIETPFKESVRRNLRSTNTMNSVGLSSKTEVADATSSSDCAAGIDSPNSTVCGVNSPIEQSSSSFRIALGQNETEKLDALRRYHDFDRWLWKECFNSSVSYAIKYSNKRCPELLTTCDACHESYLAEDKHCPSCHKTFEAFQNSNGNYIGHVVRCEEKRKLDFEWKYHISESSIPVRIRMLKSLLAFVEASIPPEALQSFWTGGCRKSWAVKLHSSSSAEDLFQILTLLEGAIKRDHLSSNFETTKELLSTSKSGSHIDQSAILSGSVPVLPWLPHTTAAVALRFMELDAAIYYMMDQKMESRKEREDDDYQKFQSRHKVVKNVQEPDPTDFTTDRLEHRLQDTHPAIGMIVVGERTPPHGSSRGRVGRPPGRGLKRGLRSVRSRPKVVNKIIITKGSLPLSVSNSGPSKRNIDVEGSNSASPSSESSGDGFEYQRRPEELIGEASGDDDTDGEGDVDVDGDDYVYPDAEADGDGGGGGVSASSEYSD
ncbi:hypothetical protein QJS04_geneDACA008298 [Acorus gramineus]|uniref:Homeobox-DDT domain protein RLT1 n=1 Tax=Acorus gramineus TaxID=55184 RepID=A0AAV9AXT1_ACOGR|nr:hypothetical protein QJS04_geneDACA008298 [Acorus gramineus]